MFSCRSLSIFRMMILNSLQAVAGSPFLSEFSPRRFLHSFSRVTSLWFFPISVTLARCLWIWRSSMGWAWCGRSFTCRWVVLERAVSLVLQGPEHRMCGGTGSEGAQCLLAQASEVHVTENSVILSETCGLVCSGYKDNGGPQYCHYIQQLLTRQQWWLEPVVGTYLVAGACCRSLCSGRSWLQTHT